MKHYRTEEEILSTSQGCATPSSPLNGVLRFTVFGTPVPQGSMRAFLVKGRPIVTSANSKMRPWRQEIAGACLAEMARTGFRMCEGQAIFLTADFYFDRPKSLSKKVMNKITKPDFDKLIRAVCDALTGVAFKDDAQVIQAYVSKQFGQPRAEIKIEAM